jgi:hypothetical protein
VVEYLPRRPQDPVLREVAEEAAAQEVVRAAARAEELAAVKAALVAA